MALVRPAPEIPASMVKNVCAELGSSTSMATVRPVTLTASTMAETVSAIGVSSAIGITVRDAMRHVGHALAAGLISALVVLMLVSSSGTMALVSESSPALLVSSPRAESAKSVVTTVLIVRIPMSVKHASRASNWRESHWVALKHHSAQRFVGMAADSNSHVMMATPEMEMAAHQSARWKKAIPAQGAHQSGGAPVPTSFQTGL